MIRHKKLPVAAAFSLIAVAVGILCFGSLINFHQYKIWGKPLIPTFVGYKRDAEKQVRTAGFSTGTGSDFSLLTGFTADPVSRPGNDMMPNGLPGFLFPASQPVLVTDLCPAAINGLRGPPLS